MSYYCKTLNDIFKSNDLDIIVDQSSEKDLISQLVNDDLEYSEKVEMMVSLLPELDALPAGDRSRMITVLFQHAQFVAFREAQNKAALEQKNVKALESSSSSNSNSNSLSSNADDDDRVVFKSLQTYAKKNSSGDKNGKWNSSNSSSSSGGGSGGSGGGGDADYASTDVEGKSSFFLGSVGLAAGKSRNGSEAAGEGENEDSSLAKPSIWYTLPVDLSQRILGFLLDPDMLGYLVQVSKVNPFAPRKVAFREVCEHIYSRQLLGNGLKFKETGRDWKEMLVNRPRLRTNGAYFLRTIYSKAHCNDNFWEGKKHEIIELKMYRNLRVYLDGFILYSLGTIEPWSTSDQFCSGSPIYKEVFEGRYTLSGRDVIIDIFLHYGIVQFKCRIKNGDDGYVGNHNMLTIYEHSCLDFSRDDKLLYDRIYSYLLVNGNKLTSTANEPVDMSFYENNFRQQYIDSVIDRYKLLEAENRVRRCCYNLPQYCDMRFYRRWEYNNEYHPK